MGSISVQPNDPIVLEWGDSVAIVYNVEDNEVARIAIAGLVGTFEESTGEPILLLVDQATAYVYAVPKSRIPW